MEERSIGCEERTGEEHRLGGEDRKAIFQYLDLPPG
ncbi:hypothetical protein T01_8831 [Trichinella spiralis]|uniref:Uncharacterized protein n=1 Tax=Trichinella spiralis TaxID=6334 RepID=A0A0V0YXJ5_TRISP|nr:hypothetical protein T01_8831 [Trichinella spiralis]